MVINYIKSAIRQLRRHSVYSGVNVFGLAVGIASCTLILLFVQDELRYEHFHENKERIVRFVEDLDVEGRKSRLATTYPPLAPAVQAEFASVEDVVRLMPYPMLVWMSPERKYQEDEFAFVDSTFLEVFTFPLKYGDAHTALDEPFSMVLTAEMASKYFGSENPVGKQLSIKDDEDTYAFTITGVLEDIPDQTHLKFSVLASMGSLRTFYHYALDPENWHHPPVYSYGLLREGADIAGMERQLPGLIEKYMGEGMSGQHVIRVERLADIHLHSQRENDLIPGSHIGYIISFGLIACFLMLIASMNFVNLATAQSAVRAREVGVRKTMGAHRRQLTGQFLTESGLSVFIALLFSMVIMAIALPWFNELTGKSLDITEIRTGWLPFIISGIVVLMVLLTGALPAYYFSRIQPVSVVGGLMTASGKSGLTWLRKGLVVFQFALTFGLLGCTYVVFSQLDFLQNQQTGFDKERVVMVPLRDLDNQFNFSSLKERWLALPGVTQVTASSGMPGLETGLYDFMVKPEAAGIDSMEMFTLTVDHEYIETLGMEMVAGRDFSRDFSTDGTAAFIVNERAVQQWGWTDPIGKEITLQVWFNGEVEKKGQVIGVVKDFQYTSLHKSVAPMLLHIFPDTYYYDYISVRLAPGNLQPLLAALESAWNAYNPDRPFEYSFLDEKFDALYQSEARLSRIVGIFALLAVGIACLGLFGLTSFMLERRIKEVGIRKILGASLPQIVYLLSTDFLKLIVLGCVLAMPLTYITMDYWLSGFADHIHPGWIIFSATGASVLGIAILTISSQTLRAALKDPVESLRYE